MGNPRIRRKKEENLFDQLMVENFPNLGKKTYLGPGNKPRSRHHEPQNIIKWQILDIKRQF